VIAIVLVLILLTPVWLKGFDHIDIWYQSHKQPK
jgi:hypothetical protein